MSSAKIDPEFESLIPALQPEELALLEESIRREGCRDPIRQWGELIIDGHNRYRICKANDIPFGTTPIELPNREAALLWIEKNQLSRRNVPDAYRKYLLGDIAEREAMASRAAQAAEAGKASGKARRGELNVEDENVRDVQERSRAKVAKTNGVSEHALKQVKKIRDAAKSDPKAQEVVKKLRDGQIKSLSAAVKEIGPRQAETQLNPHAELSDKKFCAKLNRAFDALQSIRSALDRSHLVAWAMTEDRDGLLETAHAVKKGMEILIAELGGDLNQPMTSTGVAEAVIQ